MPPALHGQPHKAQPIEAQTIAARRGARRALPTGLALVAMLAGCVLSFAVLVPGRAQAQSEVDLFGGNFGSVDRGDESAAPEPGTRMKPGEGAVVGRVFNSETGSSIRGVTVIMQFPKPPDGSTPKQEVAATDSDGAFEFPSVPPGGGYALSFVKSGFQTAAMTSLEVVAQQVKRADFPLPPLATADAGTMLDLEAFVVNEEVAGQLVENLELRLESDQMLNMMSAEDLAKFAASDVADALKRVAGVNIVEGQFAIIRGLEDRYSSTLYNSAPVPSPDPDRQSVQLDLFPSDVVSNLLVEKTFGPQSPGNSSGGMIDIVTHDYPEEFQVKVGLGTGFNDNARKVFLSLNEGSPIGYETGPNGVLEHDLNVALGATHEFWNREFSFKAVFANEVDYDTKLGFQETLEPRRASASLFPPEVTQSGDLGLGELNLTAGRFDLTQSTRQAQTTGYGGFGFDLDEAGRHRIDASVLYTTKQESVVQLRNNGYLPGFDYQVLADLQADGQEITFSDFQGFATFSSFLADVRADPPDAITRGPLWYSSFATSQSFERDRTLLVTQLNGSHEFESIEGLTVAWATNYARARQSDRAIGMRFFVEPDDPSIIPTAFPVEPEDLGPGRYFANAGIFDTAQEVDESQGFGRLDAAYEWEMGRSVELEVSAGAWFEYAKRDVTSSFLQNPSVSGSSQFAIIRDTPGELGAELLGALDRRTDGSISGSRTFDSLATRQIAAGYLGSKATFWEDLDLLGGFRLEKIDIGTDNDSFTGEPAFDGTDAIFPTKWLFFDRLDNPDRNERLGPVPPGTTFNDQILNVDVPVDPVTGLVDLVDREQIEGFLDTAIDELKVLPSVSLTWRALDSLTLRGAYSQTVARPSLRELGYYVTVEPGTDDQVVGNPQLQLSDVESFDLRVEYVFGDFGDLVAVSGFAKRIDDPIERIAIRDPTNLEGSSSAIFRTFFNNPNQANLFGVEAEFRAGLGFLELPVLSDFSFGGNATYIEASVDRSPIEIQRAEPFFGVADGDVEEFTALSGSRRLFGQPKWIANADVTFDREAWGFKTTLSVFAISDILDAAGSAVLNPAGTPVSLTLDRYTAQFYQLDLVASETIPVPWVGGDVTLKVSVKNLTNSTRGIVYDQNQLVDPVAEREFTVGRDYSFGFGYVRAF